MIHLDFETYSELDLRKVGLDRYLSHPSTEVLMSAYALNDGPVYQDTSAGQRFLLSFLASHEREPIAAFNAQFERGVLRCLLDYLMLPSQFICVQTWAYHLSFAKGLSDVGKQVGLPQDQQKLAEGRRLISKFCKPRKPSKINPEPRWTADTAPDDWEAFKQYNVQDVVSERALTELFKPYPMPWAEQYGYALDQKINDTGWPIDMDLVDSAVRLYNTEINKVRTEMARLTEVENVNSTQQLRDWFMSRGLDLADLTEETVRKALDGAYPTDTGPVLQLRQLAALSTPKKWHALQRSVDRAQHPHRLRYTLKYGGASRTNRWSGQIFQPQNLARPDPSHGDPELLADTIASSPEMVPVLWDDGIRPLVSAIRSAITAPDGQRLVVSDLSSIESRLIGWLTGCERINKVFEEGRDTYRDFASQLYGRPETEITKEERNYCKPPVLGCGYMLGVDGLIRYGDSMGVPIMRDDSKRMVDLFRKVNWEIPAFWDWIGNNVLFVTQHHDVVEGYRLRIRRDHQFLMIDLPSGRTMYYHRPLRDTNDWGATCLSYMGLNQYTHQWERIQTHPGKITENIIQALARDILLHGMMLFDNTKTRAEEIVGHVHDEAVVLCPEEKAALVLQLLNSCLARVPAWAPGLLLDAEGYIARRFKKG